ncbi:MAG: hypothetical protein JWO38_2468 [Gemmataceae bacterium]|nr:hypothetical protein [Gemmataceae bacterium]
MILLFPDLDTLRLALTSSVVPSDVTLTSAAVSFDEQGRIYVEPATSLSRTTTKNLDRIGVKGSKRHGSDAPEAVGSWLQIMPVTKDPATPNLSSQAAVLFELGNADDLPTLVTEMLRLGNDRLGFRWFAAPDEPEARRVLLRVVGPPYYTLLRALDKTAAGTTGGVRAYLERAPRVWVEIGYTHPLAAQLQAPDNQIVLVRSPRVWLFLEEAPFQDVYDIMQFKLPAAPVGWSEAKAPKKMTVPLRLTAGNAADTPELWVIREDAVVQLDTLVRDADDRLTQRLMFAVATDPKGARTVVLRTRPSKLTPPVLPLENALGFKPFWKLPNLFLPVGKRLHPTLRRDAVRRLLADDADQVVWLFPDGRGGFTPETIPDAAFRSLEDWVDYVIEAEQNPLAAWIEATRFDFDHFVCQDQGGPKPKPDKGDKDPKDTEDADDGRGARPLAGTGKVGAKGKAGGRPIGPADFLPPPPEAKPPSEWKIRREEMERQFMAVEGPLDAAERQALWPELAVANAGEGVQTEAALCWLNALWETDPMPANWLAGWARSEYPAAAGAVRADDLDRRLNSTTQSMEDYRAVIAGFLWLASQTPVPAWLISRLPVIQKYIEQHEGSLPVRAVWLAGYRLAQLAGSDVLGLARVRDRLLQRLLTEGLSAEKDLPGFLRYAGLRDAERLRVVRDKALDLHQTVRKWTEHIPVNLPYVDLLFAYALGKLGESTPAKKLLENARREMEVPIPASWQDNKYFEAVVSAVSRNFLYKSFRYRIELVMAGKPAGGQLSAELMEELDGIKNKGRTEGTNNPFGRAEYVISRLRQQSRILEPQERIDPYSPWTHGSDPLKKELADLHSVRDPAKFADRVRRLYRDGVQSKTLKEVQFYLLHEALPLSPRAGESFTAELLNLVPGALVDAGGVGNPIAPGELPSKQGELLERALFLAGHFDRRDLVQKLVGQFADLVHGKKDDVRFKLINVVAGQCLRNLKKLGMRDEIDRFLTRLQSEVLQGATLQDLRRKHSAKPEGWAPVLQTLLSLASGWLSFGLNDQAAPILDEARNELLSPTGLKLQALPYTELARAYVTALGQGPSETGLPRITELFRKMDPGKITNTLTTASCYSRLHLNLVEDVILAVVSDEFALGPAGRRWLDDDEYLVRRRIHGDMKRERERSGL